MSTIFVRHTVEDFDTWKVGYDEHGTVRREHGITDSGLLRNVEDANDLTLILTADDLDRAREFLGSDDLRETMGRLGVVGQPDVWIANDA